MDQQHKRKKKQWAESVGPYGHRIRIFESRPSGPISGEMRDVMRPGKYVTVSLRHDDKDRARRWAQEQVSRWMNGERTARDQVPTVAYVLSLFTVHQTPKKVQSEQDADERRVKMWTRILGASKDLSKLSLREWDAFVSARRSGEVDASGEPVPLNKRKRVRDGTIAADLAFLLSVINWAVRWRINDSAYVMTENPARGFPVPAEKNPRRPVATEDRFQKVFAVAPQVTMVAGRGKNRQVTQSYLAGILALINGTGRRVSAVLALRYHDLRLIEGPHGSILWPADTDKMKREWLVPISTEVRSAINTILRERPGIGAAFLFPALKDPSKHITVESATEWLVKAEKLAKVAKQQGSLFHAYRRKWATERKFLPVSDVAAAGGWSDKSTLLNVYQQADAATMYRVVSEPSKLMERTGNG
jgi:integrase